MTKIGVFDSGLGGLATLKKLSDTHKAHYIYLGDNKRVPYGVRSREEIIKFSKEIVRFLDKFDVDFFVVACNTMAVNAIDDLRASFAKDFISVTEMGIASALEKEGDVFLLATKATVDTHIYKERIEKNSDKTVTEVRAQALVDLIEGGKTKGSEMDKALMEYLKEANEKEIPNIILGCTHYPIIEDEIRNHLIYPATIIDPADYLCDKVDFVEDKKSQVDIYMTKANPISQRMASMIMGREVVIKEVDLT